MGMGANLIRSESAYLCSDPTFYPVPEQRGRVHVRRPRWTAARRGVGQRRSQGGGNGGRTGTELRGPVGGARVPGRTW